ncbi:diguanylate cyclase domain-containing protein [Deinococcus malanensis]|uniref:GGDEF domain-containing protein n=1 Tax=Deinococcus malanensis TaxID=1706855 RepID=UPI00362B646F
MVLATVPGQSPAPAGQVSTGADTLVLSRDNIVRSYQTAFSGGNTLQPAFSWQLARAAGAQVPLDTTRRLIRLTRPDPGRLPAIPFRNVVNGEVPRSELQGRVVLIGLTGPGRREVRGPYHVPIPSVHMQARLVTSQLAAPFVTFPRWLRALLGVLTLVAAVRLRGLWGYGLAFALLALSVPLWLLGVLLPAVTLSLCAVLGAALVAAERIWNLRQLNTHDPLTGCGNRLAFTRAAEQRWPARSQRPLGLVLVEINGFRQVTDLYGREAGHELLREVASRLGRARRRHGLLFRWGSDEFAVLLDNMTAPELQRQRERLGAALSGLTYREVPVQANVGSALSTPEMDSAAQLVEAASRDHFRARLTGSQRS